MRSAPPHTQQKSKIPLSDVSRTATGSLQWKLEKNEDEKTPVYHFNNLTVYICGEHSFGRIAEDIQAAEQSVDLAFWGFDPAMELTRNSGEWPRGLTWGDLLRDATQGLNASKKKVQVRLMVWQDMLGSAMAGNLPGYKKEARYERNVPAVDAATRTRIAADPAHAHIHPLLAPQVGPTVSDQREMFNSRWWRDALAGKIEGLSLRTRGGVNEAVMNSLKSEMDDRGASPSQTERISFELVATHHQKTIVIDYEGTHPRAYVMGLNSVTDYWDTQEHAFNDARRGRNFEGLHTDHSAGKGWEAPSVDKTTLKPYQDFVCRVEGDAVVAVCKNFTEAWNTARADGPAAGSPIKGRALDLKNPPRNLTKNVQAPFQRAQIPRTLPAAEGGERSIARLYFQAGSFARHYLYIENQYFQHADWARDLKTQRQNFVKGCAAANVPKDSVPVLHVMVVTPTPEHGFMVPRTHDIVTELGHGESMPNQDKQVKRELERHAKAEHDLEAFRTRRRAYDAGQSGELQPPVYPGPPPPLSDIAQSFKDAGGSKDSQKVREELSQTMGMRTLVASLWACDSDWSLSGTSVAKKADQERLRYAQELKEWERYQAEQAAARSRSINAGGWGVSSDSRIKPIAPVERSKEIRDATARRYREIYIHSKLMIIDDSMFTLGSANLNLRSFAVDSEINIASDNAAKSQELRRRVWGQHTKGQFDGDGDATDQKTMTRTFKNWEDEASANLDRKAMGDALCSFLVKFLDERTSDFRLA
jgi:phosphatidylserine/phosphatidylglycerophosphate/cardiolipin synthase-like enzyme